MFQKIDKEKVLAWSLGDDGLWRGSRAATPYMQVIRAHNSKHADKPVHHVLAGDYRGHVGAEKAVNMQDEATRTQQLKHVPMGDFRTNGVHHEYASAPAPLPEEDHHIPQGDYRQDRPSEQIALIPPPGGFKCIITK